MLFMPNLFTMYSLIFLVKVVQASEVIICELLGVFLF